MPEKIPPGCVLVVEDPLIRKFVSGILKREGHSVVEAGLEEAQRTLRSHSAVSLLITNVPAYFLEFAETVPLIYMASSPDPALAGQFRSCRTLGKPFLASDLAADAAELTQQSA
jgi:hypothetical protein